MRTALAVLALGFAALSHAEASLPSAQAVLEAASARYRAQREAVADVRVLSSDGTVSCLKRASIDGRATYIGRTETPLPNPQAPRPRVTVFNGHLEWTWDPESRRLDYDSVDAHPLVLEENLPGLKARYLRPDCLGDRPVHVLQILTMSRLVGRLTHDGEFEGELWIDAETHFIRRIAYDMRTEIDLFQVVPARITLTLEDYRRIDTLWIPFRTVVRIEGPEVTCLPDRREFLQRQLASMREDLRTLPEENVGWRKMLEEQIPRVEQLLAGKGLILVRSLKTVEVNRGLPEELFDVQRLKALAGGPAASP